jgi:acyl-coenzyme A thioesterase PaaI-like protein
MSVPVDDGRCFACGPENPIGLRLHFRRCDGGVARASTVLSPNFQGWRGIAHGGIAMALLDEAMAHAAGFAGYRGVTARMTVRFRRALPLEVPLTIEGRLAWQRRGALGLEAAVRDAEGRVLVEGEGTFVSMGSVDAVADRRNPAACDGR